MFSSSIRATRRSLRYLEFTCPAPRLPAASATRELRDERVGALLCSAAATTAARASAAAALSGVSQDDVHPFANAFAADFGHHAVGNAGANVDWADVFAVDHPQHARPMLALPGRDIGRPTARATAARA